MKMLNATHLKIIAITLMLLDHIHQFFIDTPDILTILGRSVFPIFLFCSAESFHHTHSKGKYILRLGIASIIMAIGSITLMHFLPNPNIFIFNSAFACFFITAFYMLVIDMIKKRNIATALILAILPILSAIPTTLILDNSYIQTRLNLLIPSLFTLQDGGYPMVALGVLFYIFRSHRVAGVITLLAFSALSFLIFKDPFQPFMALAIIPILFYNSEKGKGLKYFFYIFYPFHIWLLYILATIK